MTRFKQAMADWKDAFKAHQAELAAKKKPAGGVSILQLTHERFADQGRDAVIAMIERRKMEASQ